ncbi:casein kinase II, regulatory subunit [Polychytrium aggregatum]|uniref:casein kinase II, regulatory subunit n=1 Tax=Polychytrium aggregatum TaxID=110093 RepID=UPI0022FE64A9|nr:casein kinase II, regulatory subunit [Polychytrium aggregatum]KAI9207590.1 casein kinase II, regulatory subunit [Polychytrium aggregatum]
MAETWDSSESSVTYWVEWFHQLRGNELFCEVDQEYILDRFNLTGLPTEVPHYAQAFEMITDSLEDTLDEPLHTEVVKAAKTLYGLIHARFVITARGLTKMAEKFREGCFGRCPRVLCHNQPVLPIGITDIPGIKSVKLYCPSCEDIYNPTSRRHLTIDGAYFGTTFPHLLLQMFPELLPEKSTERYVPKIFGFKIHHTAREQRKQDELREQQQKRLEEGL